MTIEINMTAYTYNLVDMIDAYLGFMDYYSDFILLFLVQCLNQQFCRSQHHFFFNLFVTGLRGGCRKYCNVTAPFFFVFNRNCIDRDMSVCHPWPGAAKTVS